VRTVTFQSVLNGAARLLGLDPVRDLNLQRAGTLAEYITTRCAEGWKFDFWPEWTVSERRAYRDNYSSVENITATMERWYVGAGNYYQALRDQSPAAQAPATFTSGAWVENSAYWAECRRSYTADVTWQAGLAFTLGQKTQNPDDGEVYQCHTAHTAGASFDLTKFGKLTPFQKYVAYEQTAKTAMDEVKGIYRKDPRVIVGSAGSVGYFPTDLGIAISEATPPNLVWVEFRLRPPVFTATPYKVATTYAIGEAVYYAATGECYVSRKDANQNHSPAEVNSSWWSKQNLPLILAPFVKLAAAADGMMDQKQNDRAAQMLNGVPGSEDRGAYGKLQDAHDQAFAGQRQFDRAEVQTYGSESAMGYCDGGY
jgi:hypothetical protein